jgi:DNA-binding IclR family transcriptional regulator
MAAEKAGAAEGGGGVMAIQLVLSVLEMLAREDSVGVSELSRALGTTKARVFRHLRTLVDQGYAVQDEGSERYAAGPRLLALSRMAMLTPDDGLIRLARPTMLALRDAFGQSVNLSLVYGNSASIVETLPGKSFVGVMMRTHMPMPLHSTAAGKLLLADMLSHGKAMPEGVLEQFTAHSITDVKALVAELERVAAQGWATAPEETVLGINAISAPVRGHRGELVAMVSLVGSIQFIPGEPPHAMIEGICAAAAEISASLAPWGEDGHGS